MIETGPRPSDEYVAKQERIFRAWANGEDTDPGAYDDAIVRPAAPEE